MIVSESDIEFTFGEQYGAMHLNQTFTGLAIGGRTC